MTVEEQFRDTKGKRFGAKLAWTAFRDPIALARFVTLLAVALLIWMLAGIAAAFRDPSLRLVCKYKGPRQSFVTIGVRAIAAGPPDLVVDADSVPLILDQFFLRPIAALVGAKWMPLVPRSASPASFPKDRRTFQTAIGRFSCVENAAILVAVP